MDTLQLKVPNVTCDGWVITIRTAVRRIQGVGQISGNGKARTITLEYDSAIVTPDAIQQAMINIGYDSTVITWTHVHRQERISPAWSLRRGRRRRWDGA